VVKPVTRRKFGRVVGTTAGIAGVSGISSATDGKEDQAEPQSNVEVRYDRVVEDGKVSVLHKAACLERLLAEGVSKTKQADGEIHEDQLLNFLVNRLDAEVSTHSLANNAEITA